MPSLESASRSAAPTTNTGPMTKSFGLSLRWLALGFLVTACGGSSESGSAQDAGSAGDASKGGSDSGADAPGADDGGSGTRTLTAFSTPDGTTVPTGYATKTGTCSQLTRDTSSCQAARQALGLTGNWLAFSCNVVEGLATSSQAATTSIADAAYVTLSSTGLPDHPSNYYPTTGSYDFAAYGYTVTGTFDSLYAAFSTYFPDPNSIAAQSTVMYVPPFSGGRRVGVAGDGRPERRRRGDGHRRRRHLRQRRGEHRQHLRGGRLVRPVRRAPGEHGDVPLPRGALLHFLRRRPAHRRHARRLLHLRAPRRRRLHPGGPRGAGVQAARAPATSSTPTAGTRGRRPRRPTRTRPTTTRTEWKGCFDEQSSGNPSRG